MPTKKKCRLAMEADLRGMPKLQSIASMPNCNRLQCGKNETDLRKVGAYRLAMEADFDDRCL